MWICEEDVIDGNVVVTRKEAVRTNGEELEANPTSDVFLLLTSLNYEYRVKPLLLLALAVGRYPGCKVPVVVLQNSVDANANIES